MKVLVCFLLLFGYSQALESYFAQNVRWMEELGKNKDETLRKLASIDFHLSKDMIVNATRQFIDYSQQRGYVSEINSTFCIQHLMAWVQDLLDGQLWAVEVIDSIGKLNSGLARGNFRAPGHFRQCVNINRQLTPEQGNTTYHGKMCIVPMTSGFHELENAFPPADGQAPFPIGDFLPEGLWLDFGFCIPASCNGTRLGDLLGFIGLFLNMRPATIFQQNEDLFCNHSVMPPLTWFEWVAIGLIIAGFAGMILNTIIDMVAVKLEIRLSPLTVAMSVYTNGRNLFNLRKNKDHIQCLYGIRALALIWLMYGYRHVLSVILPLINTLDFILDFAPSYFSPWVTSCLLALDAILLLNGVHIAYTFFRKMEKDGRVSIFKMYIHRYLKVTPYVAILILFLLTITKYSNDGPYFTLATESQVPACNTYFWSAVLHVQNYVNPHSLCILHTFFLSVDMQLFWASPLLLFPLYFWGPWVTVFVVLMSGLAVACAFTASWFNGYQAFFIRMFMEPEKLQNFLRQIFFATHIRMSSWLIGILVGYVLWKLKDRKSPIPWFIETFLWICSFSGIIAVVYWIYPFQQAIVEAESGIEYVRGDDLQNALYIAFSRYIFALSLGWIIYGCHTGSGLFVNWFFSLGFWMPFARMGVAIFLVSLSAQMVIVASQKTPYVFDSLETWHAFNGDMVVVLIFASMVYLMLEAPLMVLEKGIYDLFKPNDKKTTLPGTLGHQEEPEIVKPPPSRSWF